MNRRTFIKSTALAATGVAVGVEAEAEDIYRFATVGDQWSLLYKFNDQKISNKEDLELIGKKAADDLAHLLSQYGIDRGYPVTVTYIPGGYTPFDPLVQPGYFGIVVEPVEPFSRADQEKKIAGLIQGFIVGHDAESQEYALGNSFYMNWYAPSSQIFKATFRNGIMVTDYLHPDYSINDFGMIVRKF